MPRLQPINSETSDAQSQQILADVKSKMGMVPNLISTMAQSPAVANAYLAFSGALGGGNLSPRLREQLSLVVGEANGCNYCVSAHAALGKAVGLTEQDVSNARQGSSENGQEDVAIRFAQKVVRDRAQISNEDVQELRDAGFSDGDISEIIGNVALNIFTNYFNEIAGTEIDFPLAPALAAV